MSFVVSNQPFDVAVDVTVEFAATGFAFEGPNAASAPIKGRAVVQPAKPRVRLDSHAAF